MQKKDETEVLVIMCRGSERKKVSWQKRAESMARFKEKVSTDFHLCLFALFLCSNFIDSYLN